MDSIIDEQEGSDADVKSRIGKATTAFLQSRNLWNLKQLPTSISQNLQYERQESSTVRSSKVENHYSHRQKV
ncbi:unnamed protein product [Schistosoma curassoni]|uniref:Ovule protein n=1 Tax=Schistosoma curassoni TaxID=6186 RepID=A0A183K3N9_9TREM|nr:unnamed protein product [Schistosoma curassoni]